MIRIESDGTILDVDPAQVIAVTKTANSLEDAQFFQSSQTNEVTFPDTETNRAVFGSPEKGLNNGTNYSGVDLQLFNKGGVPVMTKGTGLFSRFEDGAVLNIIEGIADFFEELGETKLFEIDYSAYAHTWDLTEVTASANNTVADGYIYAIADFGNLVTTDVTLDVREQYPSFFVKTLFNLIATQLTSYTFTDDFYFANSVFESLVVPFNGEKNPAYTGFEFDYDGFEGNLTATTYNLTDYAPTIANDSFILGTFEAPSARQIDLEFDVEFSVEPNESINITINLISDLQGTLATDTVNATAGAGGDVFPATASATVTLSAGEQVRTQIAVTSVSGAGTDATYRFRSIPPAITFGSTLNFESLMPNMTCADFIRSVWRMFGIQPQIDTVKNTITLRGFEEYATDIASAEDWTDKVDSLASIEIEYKYGSYAKANLFKFKEDSTLSNPTFADGQIDISNENLPISYDMIELDFAPTSSVSIADGALLIARLPILNVSGVITTALEPRICYANTLGTRPTINFTDGTSTNNNVSYDPLKFTDVTLSNHLAFNNDLKTQRFAQFALMIQYMQKVTLRVKLTDNDFNSLDFFKLKYLNYSDSRVQLNGFFLLQELKEYQGGETTEVELINVNIV